MDGKLERLRKIETNREDVLSSLYSILDNAEKFHGISVGFPGFVNNGVVMYPPNFPAIEILPVQEILHQRYNVPVVVENDANLYALGEYTAGAGKESKNMVLFTLGTGVGGGIVIDGEIYRGSRGFAGELGHIIINPDGPLCGCGMRGCLEAYIGAERIIETFVGYRRKGFASVLDYPESVKEIYLAAMNGDPLSRFIFSLVGKYLGLAIVSLVNILDPDLFVIGGGISGAWKFIKIGVEEVLNQRLIEGVKVKRGKLGDRAGIIGGWYFLEKYGQHQASRTY